MPRIQSDTTLLTRVDRTFSYYTDNTHIQRLVKKGPSTPLPPESNHEAWETCIIKLHISMSMGDYLNHHDKVIEFLKNYIKPTILFQFKHVNISLIHEKQALKNQFFDVFDTAIQDYLLDQKNVAAIRTLIAICTKLEFSEEEIVSFLSQEDYRNEKIKEITDKKNNHLRFLDSDQFTLYIPSDFNQKKIYEMCKDIQNFISGLQVVPGRKSDAACPLTPFINVRQEYLVGDNERINAVLTSKSDLNKRQAVLSQIQSHPLYIYLSKKMKKHLMPRTSSSPILCANTLFHSKKRVKETSPPASPTLRFFQPFKKLMRSAIEQNTQPKSPGTAGLGKKR